jgi:SAM-dependent methyltransferase
VGAGCGWASTRLLDAGHRVAAVDVNLDEQDGLLAANGLVDDPADLPRAEADMEALPLEPASMDLVLAAGVLHHAARPARTLVEIRRVTRRGGLVVVLDSPVYRSAVDGETMVAERAEEQKDRYGFAAPAFGQGYLLQSELKGSLRRRGLAARDPRLAGPRAGDRTRPRGDRPLGPSHGAAADPDRPARWIGRADRTPSRS